MRYLLIILHKIESRLSLVFENTPDIRCIVDVHQKGHKIFILLDVPVKDILHKRSSKLRQIRIVDCLELRLVDEHLIAYRLDEPNRFLIRGWNGVLFYKILEINLCFLHEFFEELPNHMVVLLNEVQQLCSLFTLHEQLPFCLRELRSFPRFELSVFKSLEDLVNDHHLVFRQHKHNRIELL